MSNKIKLDFGFEIVECIDGGFSLKDQRSVVFHADNKEEVFTAYKRLRSFVRRTGNVTHLEGKLV